MPPVRTWNDINKILDSIDWSEFFNIIDENNQFQALGRSLKTTFRIRLNGVKIFDSKDIHTLLEADTKPFVYGKSPPIEDNDIYYV